MSSLIRLSVLLILLAGCSLQSDLKPQSVSEDLSFCIDTETAFNCVKVVDIYDGDTIFIDIPGNHPLFGKRMGVRILGIDPPELNSKNLCEKSKAKEAKAILESLLLNAERIDIVDVEKDKYFRILGSVLADGVSVADELIRHGVAYPYNGEKKPSIDWCK